MSPIPPGPPDGREIAYLAQAEINDNVHQVLHLMDADGSNPRVFQAAYVGADLLSPDWSPDGQTIVFQAQGGWLFSVPSDGSADATTLTTAGNDRVPSWSPEGDAIIFSRSGSGLENLYMVSPDGSGVAPITTAASQEYYGGSSWQPVCTIQGTPDADELTGTSGPDVVCAGSGNYTVRSLGGKDVIFAGVGADEAYGGDGAGVVVGETGADLVSGGGGSDLVSTRDGKRGNDQANGSSGSDNCIIDKGDAKKSCP